MSLSPADALEARCLLARAPAIPGKAASGSHACSLFHGSKAPFAGSVAPFAGSVALSMAR